MKYSLQSLVEEYTRSSQHKPTSFATSAAYATSRYAPSCYAPTQYAPTQYAPTQYAPKQSSAARYGAASGYAPALRSAANHTPTRRSLRPARAVRFTNDVVFQDHIRLGDLQQVGRFLRSLKVRVNNLFPSGMAAIHEAVLTGNLDCVKLLVTYGADVHLRDEDGWTALHMACSDGYPEIARYLLSLGASTVAENESGEKPADLIDPECTELVKLFEVGCV